MLKSFLEKLYQPANISSLVFFRFCFGLIMFWEVCRYYYFDWIKHYYIEPPFHFKYYGFSWVKILPGDGLYYYF